MSYRSLPRRLGATALSVLAAVSLSVVGLAGVASAALSAATISGASGVGLTLTAGSSGGTSPTYAWFDCTTSVTSSTLTSGSPVASGSGTCAASATMATGATHTVTAADLSSGPYITVVATDTTSPPYWQATSVTATAVTVSIGGHASAGQTLTATPAGGTVGLQWYDCTTPTAAGYVASGAPTNCTAISGAAGSTYVLAATDYSYYVTVTATLTGASIEAVALSTVVVSEPAPALVNTPSLGISSAGFLAGTQATPTALASAFAPSFNVTTTYLWYDCNAQQTSPSTTLPTGCTAIGSTTFQPDSSASYTFTVSDLSSYVLVQVTETNAVGSATLYSASTTGVITGASPTISGNSYPTLGTQTVGQVAVGGLGSWTGAPSPTSYTYTWYRCNTSGIAAGTTLNGTCYAIAGSSSTVTTTNPGTSYTFTSADLNHTVLIGVTANNGIYSTYTAYSGSSATFTGSAPSVTVDPSITGTPGVGNLLGVNTGTWSGAPQPTSFSYAWYLCTGSHPAATWPITLYSGCSATGFTGSTYSVPTGAANQYALVDVTTNNGVGTLSFGTATSGQIAPATGPSAGSVGITLGANGTYSASITAFTGAVPAPTLYSYTWYDCRTPMSASGAPSSSLPSLTNCTQSFSTSNSTTHAVTSSDVSLASGGGIMVIAQTTTVAGTYYVNSATSPITNQAPTAGNVSITGSGSLGSPFTATATWAAIPAPSITYQWYMCGTPNATPPAANCVAQSAFASTFSPTTYNATYPYAIVVATANNGVGSSTMTSGGALLTPTPLVVTTYPSITVTPVSSQVTTASMLSVSTGVWQGVPAPTFTYQWYNCTSPVAVPSSSVPGGCSVIPGATGLTYVPTGGYVGQYFIVQVTGTNGYTGGGSLSVFTASTASGLISTLSITSLTISGTATVGSTLVASGVVNSQTTNYTTAYQWYQCTLPVTFAVSVPYYCSAIAGATTSTFVPTTTQTQTYVTVLETVTSGASSATAIASSTALITTNIPGAPASVTAYPGAGQATVSWTTPTTGLAATSYTVTSNPGAFTCTATTLTCVVTGLLYGTSYTFSVKATNAYGTSAASVNSNAVMPTESVPGAPTTVSATAGVLSATVTWTAAAQNGAVISLYTVTSSPGNFSCTTTITSCTVTGLAANTPYTFTVSARNAVGVGPSSYVSAAVSPKPNTPNGPVGISTKRGNHQLTVSWSAGSANGATVTGYLVTASGGGASKTCSTTGYRCVVSGLTNGIPYAVSVVAQSTSGSSPAVNGPAMVPAGPPSAPSIFHSARGAGVIVVYFHAPAQNNGAPVAYYQYLISGRWTVQPLKGRLFIVLRGLARHHAYIIRVRAVSVGGASGASNYVRVITL